MTLPPSEVHEIEAATRGQTENKLWQALHNGRLTSSRFGEILHRRPTTDPRRLLMDIMGYRKDTLKNIPPQIRWGHDNEFIARKCYLASRLSIEEEIVIEQMVYPSYQRKLTWVYRLMVN